MTQKNQIYKCNICGNIVEIKHEGAEALVCCTEPMNLIEENTDKGKEGKEKHFPVIKEQSENSITVAIGEMPHPMEENHHIEWIQVIYENGDSATKFLKSGEEPKATFNTDAKVVAVREYCNLHGLWRIDL